jgi:hypothetical protein
LERLVLVARVVLEDGKYIARVDGLPLEGSGESVLGAQDALIHTMRAWIETCDGANRLEGELAKAGFPGVEEETELQLEFVE